MILRRLEDTTVLAMEYPGCPGQASRGGRSGGLRVSTSAVISSRLPHILHICMKPEPHGTAVLQLYATVLLGATIVSIRVQSIFFGHGSCCLAYGHMEVLRGASNTKSCGQTERQSQRIAVRDRLQT